jgi:hypothetical protein
VRSAVRREALVLADQAQDSLAVAELVRKHDERVDEREGDQRNAQTVDIKVITGGVSLKMGKNACHLVPELLGKRQEKATSQHLGSSWALSSSLEKTAKHGTNRTCNKINQ